MKKRWGFLILALVMALGLLTGLSAALAEDGVIELYYISDDLKDRVPLPDGGIDRYQIQAQPGATFAVANLTDPKAAVSATP